jgi:hypothetical protein
MKRLTVIEHAGVEYNADVATIERTFLGREDHGIFTAYLCFKGESYGQCEQGRALQGESLYTYVDATLKVLGVDTWEQVARQRVFVLRQGSAFGTILGIAHLTEDRVLVWPELFKDK